MAEPDFTTLHPVKSSSRPWRWVIVLIVLGLVVWAGWHFWGGANTADKKGGPPTQIPVVSAAPVVRRDVPLYLDGLGTVGASNIVTVHSQVDGQLIDAPFKEGADIKAGEILARIDPRLFKAQLDQALANQAKDQALLENARVDYQRYGNLGNTISAQALATQASTVKQLAAAVQADQAAADNARTQLSYTVIKAPISGRTGTRQVDVGNIIHPGDANGIVVITQIEPINVIFSLPQQNLQAINREMNVQDRLTVLALDADNKTVLDQGSLEFIDNQIDQTTGTIRLQAQFPNQDHMLWPGGFTNVRLMLNTLLNVLTVPTVAIQRGPQSAYVFVLKDDRTVEMRNVETGSIDGADTVITSGLNDGEQVITDGTTKLQDKAKVSLPGDAPQKPDEKRHPKKAGAAP